MASPAQNLTDELLRQHAAAAAANLQARPPRPVDQKPEKAKVATWDCEKCAAKVFERKFHCYKCGTSRPGMTEEEARERAAAAMSDEQELRIPIEYWMVGGVIGPGGTIVKKLALESKCRIKVESAPKGSDPTAPGCVILGPALPEMLPRAEALVRKRLEEILAEGPSLAKVNKHMANSFGTGMVTRERICQFWTMGACPNAENCPDAHGEQELGTKVPIEGSEFWKIRELPLEGRLVGAMIGPKGIRLQALRESAGVTIKLEKGETPDAPAVVRIGPAPDELLDNVEVQVKEAIEVAKLNAAAKELLGEGKVVELPLEAKLVGALIGPKGVNLQSLRERAGCRVAVDQDQDKGAAKVKIGPAPDEVLEGAKALVLEAIDAAKRATGADKEGRTIEIPLEGRLVGALIGPGGAAIQALNVRAGCRVSIEKPKERGSTGAPAKVQIGPAPEHILRNAETEVQLAIDFARTIDMQGQDAGSGGRVVEMPMDARLVGALIGPKGCHTQAIEMIVGCRVFVEKGDGHATVHIGPASEAVLEAAQREVGAAIRAARAGSHGPGSHFGVAAHLGLEEAKAACGWGHAAASTAAAMAGLWAGRGEEAAAAAGGPGGSWLWS